MTLSNSQYPIISNMRKGSPDDPFVEITESFKVVNGKVILSEIPNKYDRVTVVGNNQTWFEVSEDDSVTSTSYYVDYTLGVITFNPSNDGLFLQFTYKGKGTQYFPINRIYTKYTNQDITETLKDVLNESQSVLDLSNRFTNLGEYSSTAVYYDRNIVTYQNGAYMCINNSADGITGILPTDSNNWREIVSVQQAITNAETATQNAVTATTNANIATTNANNATTSANDAATYASNAGDSVITNWLNPVASFANISTTYPTPVLGDTVQVLDNGYVYRFNNVDWEYTQGYSATAMADIQNKIGDLPSLQTTDKSSLVNSVNEVTSKLAQTMKNLGIHGLNRSKFYEKLYSLNKTNGKVVWEGDSITENDDYDERIATLFPNITHVHGGIGGNTTLDLINRIDTIKANNADLYVIAIGINDARYNDTRGATTKSAYISNMTTIIDSLKLSGDVVVVGIWPHFHPDQYASLGTIGTDKRMDDWNAALNRLCKQKGIIFINPAPEIRKVVTLDVVPTFFPDGVHPATEECKQLYADSVLFGNVNRENYFSEPIRATGKYVYKLEIYSSDDPSYVVLRDLVPDPLPVTGEYYGMTANTGYAENLPQLFQTNPDTFAGYANKAGDFPLIITWASTSPLTSLSQVGKTTARGIKDFILYETTEQDALANLNHRSWKVLKRSMGNASLQPYEIFSILEKISFMGSAPSALQSVPATMTKLNYPTIKFDENNEYDSANSRFTAKEGGVYSIQAAVSFTNDPGSNTVGVQIYKNGGGHTWIYYGTSSSIGARTVIGESKLLLNAGDYIEIFAFSNTTQNTDPNETKNYFRVTKVS